MITPDLLRRYAQDDLTTAERAVVEQWLAEHDHTEVPPTILNAEQVVKTQMWQHIQRRTIFRSRYLASAKDRSRRGSYAIAASLLLLVSWAIFRNGSMLDQRVTISNVTGHQPIKKTLGELTYVIEPGSRCDVVISYWKKESDVSFCGAISVANHSRSNSDLHIHKAIADRGKAFSDELIIRKGQTYLAMTDDEYNVIAATTDELNDGLPGPFSARLHQRFSL